MKAMVIGIDSASPVLIEKWKDTLPNLRSIMDNGAYGVLKSIVPPESVPAWQCFATGKNPAKIGLFGFSYIGRDRKLRHGRTTPDIGCFWDICSNRGLKVGVEAYLPQVDRLHTKCLEAAKALLGWFHPDVFMMTFQGIDLVHHDFWRYMDDQNSPYRNVLRDWYVKMDRAVQELRQFATADTNLLLLSDHGSAPASAALYVNEYLAENGMLKTNNRVKQSGEVLTRFRSWLLRNLSPETIARVYKISPSFISKRLTLSGSIDRVLQNLIDNISWEETKCFSTGGHQAHFYITNQNGDVAQSELRDKLINMMGQLIDPTN